MTSHVWHEGSQQKKTSLSHGVVGFSQTLTKGAKCFGKEMSEVHYIQNDIDGEGVVSKPANLLGVLLLIHAADQQFGGLSTHGPPIQVHTVLFRVGLSPCQNIYGIFCCCLGLIFFVMSRKKISSHPLTGKTISWFHYEYSEKGTSKKS